MSASFPIVKPLSPIFYYSLRFTAFHITSISMKSRQFAYMLLLSNLIESLPLLRSVTLQVLDRVTFTPIISFLLMNIVQHLDEFALRFIAPPSGFDYGIHNQRRVLANLTKLQLTLDNVHIDWWMIFPSFPNLVHLELYLDNVSKRDVVLKAISRYLPRLDLENLTLNCSDK
jgi:hypothetical protein